MGRNSPTAGVNRALAALDREQDRVRARIAAFVENLEKDPISAVNLRFTETQGFEADPFEFTGKILSGRSVLLSSEYQEVAGTGTWNPESYHEGTVAVEPLSLSLSQWGTMLAVRVSHDQPTLRIRPDWLKKSDPSSGPVYLVDPVNHQYLHLKASSLRGEVLPGIPRTGILVFEVVRYPTDRLQLHFSGVRLGEDSTHRSSFHLELTDERLPRAIEHMGTLPTMRESLTAGFDQQVNRVRSGFLRQQSGCSGPAVAILAAVAAALLV